MSTTFPIEYNTIRINFINLSDQLFECIICILLIESVIDLFNGVWWTLINQNFSSLLSFLLNRGEERIISAMLLEGYNDSYSLFICIVRLCIKSTNFLWIGWITIVWILIILLILSIRLRWIFRIRVWSIGLFFW